VDLKRDFKKDQIELLKQIALARQACALELLGRQQLFERYTDDCIRATQQLAGQTAEDLLQKAAAAFTQQAFVSEKQDIEFRLSLTGKQLPTGAYRLFFFAVPLPTPPRIAKAAGVATSVNLNSSVDDLELSIRSANCLQAASIRTVRQLAAKTESQLMAIKNFGKKSLVEIKTVLAELGLHLKGK
jgi:DNA-directed RNA polymerase alpha subunit